MCAYPCQIERSMTRMPEPAGKLPGTVGYSAEAAVLSTRYESITFEDVHRETLALIPPAPCRVLDIGAGTGRDAAALARRGHRVTAVEPTAGLREFGMRHHAGLPIEWIDDGLPDLTRLAERNGAYDLIYLTAVWMHLDAPERAAAMARIAALLAPNGLVILSLRHGPVPPGRRMFDVTGDETVALAARHGLVPAFEDLRDDMMGRPEVRWTILALRNLQ